MNKDICTINHDALKLEITQKGLPNTQCPECEVWLFPVIRLETHAREIKAQHFLDEVDALIGASIIAHVTRRQKDMEYLHKKKDDFKKFLVQEFLVP